MRLALLTAVAAGLGLLASGCFTTNGASGNAIPGVRVQAEKDFDCAQEAIRITQKLGGQFEAVGCGQRATYITACEGLAHRGRAGKIDPRRARLDPTPTP